METSKAVQPDNAVLNEGLDVLRRILRRMRNEDQDGYVDVQDGKFAGHAGFVTSGLPQATPEEIDTLFALAGIVPDAIEVNGDCNECVYQDAVSKHDLGWSAPCSSCSRPKMTNFVPLSSITRSQLEITDQQAQFLENVKKRVWWATGIATAKKDSKEWYQQLLGCERSEKAMRKRDMIGGDRRLTNKGLKALQNHQKQKKSRAA